MIVTHPFTLFRSARVLKPIPALTGQEVGASWTGHQYMAGITQTVIHAYCRFQINSSPNEHVFGLCTGRTYKQKEPRQPMDSNPQSSSCEVMVLTLKNYKFK